MAISDLILQLGKQSKHLEDTASALHADNDAQLKAREKELRSSLAKVKSAVDKKLAVDSEGTANRVAELQRTLSAGFEALRTDVTAHGIDTEDAVAFAVHALQEAEYLLAAAAGSDDADRIQDDEAQAAPTAEIQGGSVDVPVVKESTPADRGAAKSDTTIPTRTAANTAVAVTADKSSVKTKAPATPPKQVQSTSPKQAESKSPKKAQSKRPPE